MTDWKTLSSKPIYECPWLTLFEDQVTDHNGKQVTYSYIKMPHEVVTILPVNEAGKLLLQRNYRYPIKQRMWEPPAGHTDGQEPLVAAKRELLEEAGMESDDWQSLGDTYHATGSANIHNYLFVARNVKQVTADRDPDEDISESEYFSPGEVIQLVRDGVIQDGNLLSALMKYIVSEGAQTVQPEDDKREQS